MKKHPILFSMLIFSLAGMACRVSLPTGTEVPPTIPAAPAATSAAATQTPVPAALPEHRIGVRLVDGVGEFYDRLSGEKFIPRGNNFIRLDPMIKKGGGQVITFSTFNPGFYDTDEARQALQQMQASGYNVVRVFAESEGMEGMGDERGLNPLFMDNLADFLSLAKENGLVVILTKQWLPISQRYGDILANDCCERFNFANAIHLAPAGIEAHQLFFQDLARELVTRNAPLDAILSYSISNEFYFDSDQPPLSWSSGMVTLGSGETYDMSIPEDKTEMMDDATLAMIDGVRSAIREVDPTALVSMGYFAPQEPNPLRVGDTRISRTRAAIWESSADYIDLHAYPGGDAALAQIVDNYGMQGMQTKPIIMGEFGAFDNLFPSVDSAASALVAWQVESCQYGFDGWLLWTWDDNTQGEILPATAGEGQIGRSLAPATRPDACAYGGMVEKNLALDAYTRASSALPNEPSELAVDGLGGTQWGAGADAPQWFEIDLGTPAKIHEIRLQVAQYPEGETKHTVLVRNASGSFQAAAVFDQFTRSEEWLVFRPENPLEGVQVVRVETAYSPSWVAWKEIQVFGEPH